MADQNSDTNEPREEEAPERPEDPTKGPEELAMVQASVVAGVTQDGETKEVPTQEYVEELESAKGPPEEVEEVDEPNLFLLEDERVSVVLDVFFSSRDGEVLGVQNRNTHVLDYLRGIPTIKVKTYESEFSVPDYDTLSGYRRISSFVWRNVQLVDRIRLRNYFLLYHFEKTELPLRDSEGKSVELQMVVKEDEEQPSLSDESLAAIFQLRPIIIEVLMATYERNAMLQF